MMITCFCLSLILLDNQVLAESKSKPGARCERSKKRYLSCANAGMVDSCKLSPTMALSDRKKKRFQRICPTLPRKIQNRCSETCIGVFEPHENITKWHDIEPYPEPMFDFMEKEYQFYKEDTIPPQSGNPTKHAFGIHVSVCQAMHLILRRRSSASSRFMKIITTYSGTDVVLQLYSQVPNSHENVKCGVTELGKMSEVSTITVQPYSQSDYLSISVFDSNGKFLRSANVQYEGTCGGHFDEMLKDAQPEVLIYSQDAQCTTIGYQFLNSSCAVVCQPMNDTDKTIL